MKPNEIVPLTHFRVELLGQSSWQARRAEAAHKILPFFARLIERGNSGRVTIDLEKVILYLDAMRSRDFMDEIEHDRSMTEDDRVNLANLVTGLNKGWPQILRFFRDERNSGRAIALGVALLMGVDELMDAFSVKVVSWNTKA